MATPPILFLLLLLLLLLLLSFHLSSASVPNATTTLTIPPIPVPVTLNINNNNNNNNNGNYLHIAREFLNSHNTVRSIVGEAGFVWDKKLARHARWWSQQRMGDCLLIHSGNEVYGENMFWGLGVQWKAADAVKYWANEHLYYNYDSNSCEPNKMCGHFTQMAWNRTVRIGCGRAECYNGGVIITCNYFPPGNYVGEKPF